MKNSLTCVSLIGSFIVFALTINLFDTVAMFILFGMVPNSSVVLSADTMLAVLSTGIAVLLLFSLRQVLIAAIKQVLSIGQSIPIRRRSA